MMPALQYLRHGKALCGKVFKRFVETFNFHNDFIANIKGDGDLPMSEGLINLDIVDPRHPVIRLNRNKLKFPNQGSTALNGCFEIEEIISEDKTVKLVNCYYNIGGKTFSEEDMYSPACSITGELAYLCLVIPQRAGFEGSYLDWFTKTNLGNEQSDVSRYVIPLYAFDVSEREDDEEDGATSAGGNEDKKYMFNLVCDMRNAPCAQMWEYVQ